MSAGPVSWCISRSIGADHGTDGSRASPQYHYRPGTITGWIADLLERHAIRRRSAAAHPTSSAHALHSAVKCACCIDMAAFCQNSGLQTATVTLAVIPLVHRAGANPRIHGRLLRHDALRPRQRPTAGPPATQGLPSQCRGDSLLGLMIVSAASRCGD